MNCLTEEEKGFALQMIEEDGITRTALFNFLVDYLELCKDSTNSKDAFIKGFDVANEIMEAYLIQMREGKEIC